MQVEIYVTAYIYKYLVKTYGSPPYAIAFSPNNDLRIALQYMMMTAEPVVREARQPGKKIIIDIGEDHLLSEVTTRTSRLLKAGIFFQHEFNQIMCNYVAAQEALAQRAGLSQKLWHREGALLEFLRSYNIEEWEYTLESAYRQLTRRRNKISNQELAFFSSKLLQKLGFRHGQNTEYTFPIIHKSRKRIKIDFSCYSRSQQKKRRVMIDVPSKVIKQGQADTYLQKATAIIQEKLISGYTVT